MWENRITFILEMLIYGGFTVICSLIVLYFRCKSQNTFSEYILGDGRLGLIPVTLSMIASTISSATITTLFEEAYLYGGQYLVALVNKLGVGAVSVGVIIPLFYKLNIFLPYDYCELRFGRRVKTFLIVNYLICQTLETAMSIYVLSTFLQQVTGVNLHVVQIAGSFVCTAYTFLGGYKGVVWTDAVQAVIILFSMTFLVVMGFFRAPSAWGVLKPFLDSGRFDISLSLDPTIRLSLLSATLGKLFSQFHHSPLRPFYWQRLMSLNNVRHAKWANAIEMSIHAFVQILSVTLAVIIYAAYQHCDPVKAGLVANYLQIPQYYALQIGKNLKITQIIFILGIVAAGISSISTSLNTMPLVLYEDVYMKISKARKMESTRTIKAIVIIFGCGCAFLSLLFKSAGPVREFYVTIESTKSINYAVLLIGIFVPFVNSKGAFWGGLTSFIVTFSMTVVSRLARARGKLIYPTKELLVDQCSKNATSINISSGAHEEIFYLFRISPFYYSLMSFTVTLIIALLVSFWFNDDTNWEGNGSSDLRPLVWSRVRRFIRRRYHGDGMTVRNRKNSV